MAAEGEGALSTHLVATLSHLNRALLIEAYAAQLCIAFLLKKTHCKISIQILKILVLYEN